MLSVYVQLELLGLVARGQEKNIKWFTQNILKILIFHIKVVQLLK